MLLCAVQALGIAASPSPHLPFFSLTNNNNRPSSCCNKAQPSKGLALNEWLKKKVGSCSSPDSCHYHFPPHPFFSTLHTALPPLLASLLLFLAVWFGRLVCCFNKVPCLTLSLSLLGLCSPPVPQPCYDVGYPQIQGRPSALFWSSLFSHIYVSGPWCSRLLARACGFFLLLVLVLLVLVLVLVLVFVASFSSPLRLCIATPGAGTSVCCSAKGKAD